MICNPLTLQRNQGVVDTFGPYTVIVFQGVMVGMSINTKSHSARSKLVSEGPASPTPIETAKINNVNPQSRLADVLARIADQKITGRSRNP